MALQKDKTLFAVGLFILTGFSVWLYADPSRTLLQAHDFLDSVFLYFKIRSQAEGFLFNPNYEITQFQNLPLNALGLRD